MKISCAVFDLDGTLLTPENKISETDLSTLHALSKKGVKIIIATGRSELQIKEYISALGIADPVITCNGGVIINPITREIIHQKFLKSEDAEAMLRALELEGTDYLFYTPDFVYHTYSSERVNFYLAYNESTNEEFHVPIRVASEYPKEKGFEDVLKILVHDDIERISELEERFNRNNSLTFVSSGRDPAGRDLIDIMPDATSKGNAIRILAEYLDIPISEIVAFGDSPNDADMLLSAGFSVAMGNADDSIKQIADFVTLPNDQNGITHALRHIMKKS